MAVTNINCTKNDSYPSSVLFSVAAGSILPLLLVGTMASKKTDIIKVSDQRSDYELGMFHLNSPTSSEKNILDANNDATFLVELGEIQSLKGSDNRFRFNEDDLLYKLVDGRNPPILSRYAKEPPNRLIESIFEFELMETMQNELKKDIPLSSKDDEDMLDALLRFAGVAVEYILPVLIGGETENSDKIYKELGVAEILENDKMQQFMQFMRLQYDDTLADACKIDAQDRQLLIGFIQQIVTSFSKILAIPQVMAIEEYTKRDFMRDHFIDLVQNMKLFLAKTATKETK